MLAIRLQRTGRSGHANYRVVVQDSRQTPTSGKVIANLGSYDPHTKVANLSKDEVERFLSNGAQPSERLVKLLKKEGIKLPKWVETPAKKEKAIRNPEKLRRNRPAGEPAPEKPAETEAEKPTDEAVSETAEESKTEEAASETDEPAEVAEAPADEPKDEKTNSEEVAKADEAPVETETSTEETPAEEAAKPEEVAEAETTEEPKEA